MSLAGLNPAPRYVLALTVVAACAGPDQLPLGPEPTRLTVITSENVGTTRVLAAAFHAKHLDVEIDVQYTPQDSYDAGLDRKLGSADAPDLALLNRIGTSPRLLRPLDDYAKQYGWDAVCPSSELDQWRTDSSGKQLGVGPLWAAPAGFSMTGVYYNKQIAARLGIRPPTTRAEFDAALAKAKSAGELPVQLGNLQGHSSFIVQSIVNAVDGPARASDWVNGKKGATLHTPGGIAAATALSDWAKKGYLPADANSRDLPAAVADFGSGKGLFLFGGSWDAQPIDKGLHGKVGFLPFRGDDGKATGIGTSVAYAIPVRSRHPDAAAAFLDYLNSPEAAQIEFNAGFLPVAHADRVTTDPGNVMADIARAWTEVNKDNGLVNFFNNTTATMNDTLTTRTQQLIAGETTPAALLDALRADWQQTH
ncbi:ABC transporter substrate-binding protein [Kitasatospora terrestris]|uniref:ABC transporter substrate-binding protein n=1 Tax=Kitasatospora terrestris TaxID=258051 RepID=A0ABP9DDK5_9ACTN